ncbi:MAG: enoyl-CoA hydratase-related protein [Gemmobacter sp.]
MGLVLIDRPSDGVALVRLNRPEVRNALNLATRKELATAFRGLADDATLRAVVLCGVDGNFSGGADIADMARIGAVEMYHRHTERLWAAVGDCPVPVIAAVEGFALGGGLELAMHCDMIVAARGARLGQPEVRVGIMPGAGGTQRLLRAVGKFRAAWLCMTGETVTAEEAERMGLISRMVEDGEAETEALALAARIARMPPIAIAQIKEVMTLGADAPLPTALALERKALQLLFATADKSEGMHAFLEKRRPAYRGE